MWWSWRGYATFRALSDGGRGRFFLTATAGTHTTTAVATSRWGFRGLAPLTRPLAISRRHHRRVWRFVLTGDGDELNINQ